MTAPEGGDDAEYPPKGVDLLPIAYTLVTAVVGLLFVGFLAGLAVGWVVF